MRGNRLIKIIMALSLLTALTISQFCCCAYTLNNNDNVSSIDGFKNTTDITSIYDYINADNSFAKADDEIPLTNSSAKLSNSAVQSVADRENVILLSSGGSAEWEISVPQDAMYAIALDYCAVDYGVEALRFSLFVDGDTPFYGAEHLQLKRLWKDAGEIKKAANGNEIAPKQQQVLEWNSAFIQDYSTYYSGDVYVRLTKGNHTIGFKAENPFAVDGISLNGGRKIQSYDKVYELYKQNGYDTVDDVLVKTQAENAFRKSDSTLIPVYDSTSSATECYDGSLNKAEYICRNTIGQSRWETPGMWISYKVEVPESGLYKLQLRTRQNTNIGMSSLRDIYIDNELPFKEAQGFVIPYASSWKITTFGEDEEHPYWIYLSKGEHEIKFCATLNRFSDVLTEIEAVNSELIQLYRRIVMVTGISPDVNRDYKLDAEIPGMMDTIKKARDSLSELAKEYTEISLGGESQVAIIKSNVKQLDSFVDDPDTIPSRLSNFQSNISSLSDWLLSTKSQALEIDYFILSGSNLQQPKAEQNIFSKLAFGIKRFLASYSGDYNSIGISDGDNKEKHVVVWFNGSRDQAQIIQDLIEEDFTSKSGISVNLSLVYQGYLESILAGCNPDIALDVARSYPVNLACRDSLLGLSQFDSFKEVMSRFDSNSADPYTYNGEVYGIPSTQSYFMLFYRTDVFAELGIEAPDTWNDFYDMIPVLQRNNYEIGLPYSAITVAGAATGGIGAKDMFATLVFQNGGSIYNSDYKSSRLDDENTFNAFKEWTEFYTTYGFPVTYNLLTRFRSGTLPVFIAPYSTYNALMGAAPEIRGLWNMCPIPGTETADGTLNRATGASGTANIIFKNASNPEACWEFLDWLSTDDAQYQYAVNLESLLGIASRSTTANLNAFNRLSWGDDVREALSEQRKHIVEIPETPGGYILSRSLDNAFRAVVYNGKNIRERYEQEVTTINEELLRKSKEFK